LKLKIAYVTALIVTIMIPSAFADSIPVEIDGTAYEIAYTSNNVIIKSVTADLDFISLIFETEVSDSSNDVSITFQRDFFDAKIGYSDDDFFILSDGDEIEFEETKTDESRLYLSHFYKELKKLRLLELSLQIILSCKPN